MEKIVRTLVEFVEDFPVLLRGSLGKIFSKWVLFRKKMTEGLKTLYTSPDSRPRRESTSGVNC